MIGNQNVQRGTERGNTVHYVSSIVLRVIKTNHLHTINSYKSKSAKHGRRCYIEITIFLETYNRTMLLYLTVYHDKMDILYRFIFCIYLFNHGIKNLLSAK